jgi:flagellum-specific peptidoglycan hydrolase FlgJ
VKSSGGNKATISSAAQSTAQSSTKDRVNTQDVENPAEPNRAADNVGSETKTASTRNVTKVTNKKKVQATQANDTTVRTMASASSATKDVTVQFINDIGGAAQRIASKNDLYASVMIAQAILESKSGQSGLAQQGNNLFGIKGTYNGQYVTMNTSEYVNGKWIEIAAQFRKYPSLSASLQDYADLLRNGLSYNANYYAKVWKSNAATYKEAAQALQGTYATDPNYASKLDTLISTYQLTNYDDGKSANDSGKTISLSTTSNLTNTVSDSSSSGETVKTHGILYASSDAAHSVKTSLAAVQVKKVYSGAKNPYQVTHNGVIVGYLRTLSSGSASQTGSGNGSSGQTVKTHGILYASSDAAHSVKTSLTAVQVKRVYSGAKNPYQVTHNGVIVGYLRALSSGSASQTGSGNGSSGRTVKTHGILYASSDAAHSVKTSLTAVQVKKVYSGAKNPYQVMHNGVIVGYLRSLSADSAGSPGKTSGTSTNVSSTVEAGTTVKTNGVIYLSSTARDPLITSLKKVQVSKLFPSARNKYQVKINGAVVGYLRFATPASTSAATVKKTIGATLATDGELYVSSMAENAVTTSLKKVRVSKIFSNALNPYQVAVNGVVVGYLR